MKLLDYIADMHLRADLASRLGRSPDYIWQQATGRRRVRAEDCAAYESATGGQVTRADLRPDIWPATTPPADAGQQEAA